MYGVEPSALVDNPAVHGMPSYGSVWDGMILDSIDVATSPEPTTAYDATANYSNNGQWRLPENRDETAPEFRTWQGGTSSETITLPIYERRIITAPTVPGEPVQQGEVWGKAERQITETRQRLTRRVVVASADFSAAVAALNQQTQNVHVFNGTQYLFLGGTFYENDATSFTFEYNWISDPGTPYDFDAAGLPDVALPGPFNADGTDWDQVGGDPNSAYARPPFSFIVPTDPTQFGFAAILQYPVVPAGYQQLVNVGIP